MNRTPQQEAKLVANHRTRAQRGVDPRHPITIRIDAPPGKLSPVMRDSLYLFRYIVGDTRAASADKALKALTRLSEKAILHDHS